MSTRFKSDIDLGEKYVDTVTGLEGMATSLHFYLHACERVSLEFVKDGKIEAETFDAPRLKKVATGVVAKVDRTGGPGDARAESRPTIPSRP